MQQIIIAYMRNKQKKIYFLLYMYMYVWFFKTLSGYQIATYITSTTVG